MDDTQELQVPHTRGYGMFVLGVAGSVFFSWVLLTGKSYLVVNKLGPAIGSLNPVGSVQVRSRFETKWKSVNTAQPIHRFDSIYVPKESRASVTLKNKTQYLPLEVTILFDDILVETWEATRLESSPPSIVKSEKLSLSSIKSLESQFEELDAKWRKHKPSHLEPVRALATSGFQRESVKDYVIELLRPGRESFSIRYLPWMEFAWTRVPIPFTKYRLEISAHPQFRKLAYSYTTQDQKRKVMLNEPGRWYWRVRADAKGARTYSSVSHFDIVVRDEVSARPQKKESDSKKYTVDVATDTSFRTLAHSGPSDTPECTTNELFQGKYHCRVREAQSGKILKTYSFEVP